MFVFAEHMEVVKLDTVPEQFRVYYKDKGDGTGFKVDTENPVVKSTVEIVTGLHSSLTASRAEAQGLKGKSVDLSLLGEFGSDVGSIAEGVKNKMNGLQTQLADLQKGGKVNVEKIKEEIAAQFATEIDGHKKRGEALTNQLYGLLVENAANEAIASEKGKPKLLMPFIKNQVRVLDEEGQFNVYVVNDKNERQYSGVTGQPLTMKELVLKMKADPTYQPLFDSEAPSGGGANTNQTNFKPGSMNQKPEMNAVDKISAGLQKGQHLKHAAPAGKETHL